MKTSWLKARQTKYTAYVTLYVAVVLAVVAVINFLANRHNWSYDSTSNKRYSLSDQTIKIVKNLKTDLKITLFDRTSRFEEARDLLDRYDNLSPRLSVEYIDPDKKPQLARAAGVTSYGTVYVEANGKREEARYVTEEEVTNAIIRVLKEGKKTICAVQGSGEHSLDETGREGYSSFKELLEKNNYETKTISLLENPEVPSDCSILLVGGPRYDYVEPVVKAIKNYVESGGRALLMLDPPVRFGQDSIARNAVLVKELENWGVVLNEDLVLDTSGIGGLFGLGPEVPLVADYGTHPIVREMREIATAFPLARSVDTKDDVDGVTVEKLFSSTSNSYATTKLDSPEIKIDPSRDKKGPFNLAVAGTIEVEEKGESGNGEEKAESGDNGSSNGDEAAEKKDDEGNEEEKKEGRFVVVGSSGWVANNMLHFNGNRDLALNMMNWLSSDEDLISIRPKEPEDRRLSLTRQQMSRIFYVSVVGLPLIILVAGISVWWRRR